MHLQVRNNAQERYTGATLQERLLGGQQCRINAHRGPWQLFARAPLLTRDNDLSQPATRVDTTCWQLFRPAINTVHFYFLLQKLCQIT